MLYADIDAIETRYPGELAQAGPRTAAGTLDEDAVDLALAWASALADQHLRVLGWTVPLTAEPFPDWLIDLVVDLALYQATPTALASQDDFADRRARYADALTRLADIAAGRLLPPIPTGIAPTTTVYAAGNDRLFGRGTL